MTQQIQDINPNASEIKELENAIAKIDLSKLDPTDNMKVATKRSQVEENNIQQTDTQESKVESKTATEPAIDPIKAELERVKGQTQGKTPQEKMAYKLKLEAQRAKEMGVNVDEIFGIKPKEESQEDSTEDRPLTRKDIEEILTKATRTPQKTATELAYERIQNETERELFLLKLDRIKPSGDAEADFNEVRDIVDAIKLKNNLPLQNLRPDVKTHSTASSYQPGVKSTSQRQMSKEEEYLFRDAKQRGVDLSDKFNK